MVHRKANGMKCLQSEAGQLKGALQRAEIVLSLCVPAGTNLKAAGRPTEASAHYEEALQVCQSHAAALYNMAVLHGEQHQVRQLQIDLTNPLLPASAKQICLSILLRNLQARFWPHTAAIWPIGRRRLTAGWVRCEGMLSSSPLHQDATESVSMWTSSCVVEHCAQWHVWHSCCWIGLFETCTHASSFMCTACTGRHVLAKHLSHQSAQNL